MPDSTEQTENPLAQIEEQIDEIQSKADATLEKIEAATSDEDREALKTDVKSLQDSIDVLNTEREAKIAEVEKDQMQSDIKSLTEALDAARKSPTGYGFNTATGEEETGEGKASDDIYGPKGEHSFWVDVKAAQSGSPAARERLYEGKAMTEGTDSAGGFLVPPEISAELLRLRDAGGVLRGLIPSQGITVDELRIAAVDNGLAVAWTAELAEKIQSEFTFSELSANVFTAAGLAVVSNQLLADSKFSLDQMISADLAKRFVSLEEQAFLNGSGTGQPRGIRQTAGVESIAIKSKDAKKIVDAIVDAVTKIYSDYFGAPDAIVMHPRTWGFLVKAREEGTPGSYVLGPPSTVYGRNPSDALPGFGSGALPRGELYGLPVYTSPNVPTTLGTNKNESCIFVANWSEGLILDREGITTAQSEHVFFTSNQTVFRSEERVGFTAARYPDAFKVIEGEGLETI